MRIGPRDCHTLENIKYLDQDRDLNLDLWVLFVMDLKSLKRSVKIEPALRQHWLIYLDIIVARYVAKALANE